MTPSRFLISAALSALVLGAMPAAAQETPTAPERVFVPDDFARFAPKTALDMLEQVPGFSIRRADQERGLGQASENVLINGQRITDKSGGAVTQLQNTSASAVDKIEIVDAAQLGISGLSGQVANVVLKHVGGTGQFEWRPDFRAHYSHPNLFRGSASYSNHTGPVTYTLSVENQANRGAFGGDEVYIRDPAGALVEQRDLRLYSDFDQPKMTARFKVDGPGSSVANLSLMYGPYWYSFGDIEDRTRTDGNDRVRTTYQTQNGFMLDWNADYEFALGPGRFKLIGLRHFEHEPTFTTQITTYDSGAPDDGTRFTRDARIGETVFRGEYHWKGQHNDWQVSFERAVNTLDQRGRLFLLSPSGSFDEVDYPDGSGQVVEHRYEGIASFSRALSPKLDLQLAGGAEASKLARLDGDIPARNFFRPKGSISLAWRPSKGWDASLKLARRVGQISFYDFLAQPNLQQDRENSANPDLVPSQSWELETEMGRELGAWGKTRLKLYANRIDDIIDIIPVGTDGEAIGNLPRAHRLGLESTSTIKFDPMGWRGAKLDATVGVVKTSVRDPLTGESRPISGEDEYYFSAELRHDIPRSSFAWGAAASLEYVSKTYFLTEVGRGWEGPVFANLFVEHKDVFGLTVRATLGNVLDARHKFDRTVYDGYRDRSVALFSEHQNESIGPIFRFSVKGNF